MKAWLCSCLKTHQMKFTPPRSKATFLILLVLILTQMAAHAQGPQSVDSKLDALLTARVREGNSGTQRVIIRTTSNGIPGLTRELERLVIPCFAVTRSSMR